MSTSTTLGGHLKSQQASLDSAAAVRAQAALAEDDAKELADQKLVQNYFELLKPAIVKSITETQTAPVIMMGGERGGYHTTLSPFNVASLLSLTSWWGPQCDEPKHTYYPEWRSFQQWAANQGLAVRWQQRDTGKRNVDGYPEGPCWYELMFAPND